MLQTAVVLLRKRGVEIDLAMISLEDQKTYTALARAEAVGIFQLESQGMRRALLDKSAYSCRLFSVVPGSG